MTPESAGPGHSRTAVPFPGTQCGIEQSFVERHTDDTQPRASARVAPAHHRSRRPSSPATKGPGERVDGPRLSLTATGPNSSRATVGLEDAAEPLAAEHRAELRRLARTVEPDVIDSLVRALDVIVLHVLGDRPLQSR